MPSHRVAGGGGISAAYRVDHGADVAQGAFRRHGGTAPEEVVEDDDHRALEADEQGVVRSLGECAVELEIQLERGSWILRRPSLDDRLDAPVELLEALEVLR